jgi:dUTP pyrophosphatase
MTKKVDVGIQLLHPEAKIPQKAHETDACADVWAVDMEYLDDPDTIGCRIKYNLGFALDVPPGHEVVLRPRSSISKHGLLLANSPGTGDESHITGYSVTFYHILKHLKPYEVGDRVAQMVCTSRVNNEYYEVDYIEPKERGYSEGYGSSGLKEIKQKGKYNIHIGDTYHRQARDVTYD